MQVLHLLLIFAEKINQHVAKELLKPAYNVNKSYQLIKHSLGLNLLLPNFEEK